MIGRIWTVARRELSSYFDHATAYILLVVFLGLNFFFFFRDAFLIGEASLRPMMGLLPWFLLFFVPAVCMRTLAEERQAGTLELVLSQPISVVEFLLGKFLGVYLFLIIAMAATLGVPLGMSLGADLQAGVIVAQYVGSAFLIGAMVSIGLWASSLTGNQVTAFILGVTIMFALFMIGFEAVALGLPGPLSTVAARLGILGHFESVARGVIDLRDVLYFAAVTAAFLSLTYASLMRPRLSRERETYRRLQIGTLGLVGFAIFAALAGGQLRGRLDLTPGKVYTLSEPTRDLLQALDDLVTIRFFRSDQLPPAYAPLRRDIEDLLRDFDAVGGGNLNLVQLSPDDDPDIEEEANALRIEPARFNVVGEGELTTREGYLGIAVQYAGESEVIPLIQRAEDLEYRLASMIRGLVVERPPRVALLTGHGELSAQNQMQIAMQRLGSEYEVETLLVDSTTLEISDSVDVLIVPGPTSPLRPEEGNLIRRHLEAGGNLFLFMGGTQPNPQTQQAGPAFHPVLDSLLSEQGLTIPPTLAYDIESNEVVQMSGGGAGFVITPYPLWMIAQPASDHIVVRGLAGVPMHWASPVTWEGADSARVTPLLSTTRFAGQLRTPVSIAADQAWDDLVAPEFLEGQTLAVAVTGETGGRMIVAGTPNFITDNTVRQSSQGVGGLIFFQNAVDWLAQDEALITIRSKDRSPPQLLFDSEIERDLVRYGNLVGVPVLFVLFGMLRLAHRKKNQLRIYETGGAMV